MSHRVLPVYLFRFPRPEPPHVPSEEQTLPLRYAVDGFWQRIRPHSGLLLQLNFLKCKYWCSVWQCENSLSQAVEVWVSHGFLCCDPFLPLKLQQFRQKFNSIIVQSWSVVVETVSAVPGVVIGDEFLIGGYSGPGLLCGCTEQFEDKVQLLLHCGAREQGSTCRHLVEDTANTPHVNLSGIVGAAQQDVRGAVPKRHHLIGVGLRGNRFCSCQTWRPNKKDILGVWPISESLVELYKILHIHLSPTRRLIHKMVLAKPTVQWLQRQCKWSNLRLSFRVGKWAAGFH